MKTQVIFALDSEDYTSNTAANAIYREAEILREEGVRGGFCIVGYLAKQLKEWGRDDVINALAHHDILSHSYLHSYHPTINEYTDIEDFDKAMAEFLKQEKEGVRLIQETFKGREVLGGSPAGNNRSYVAMYGYADLGMPIYCDSVCHTPDGRAPIYCNAYQTKYRFCMESFMSESNSDEFMKKKLDELSEKKTVMVYTHPNMATHTNTWDCVNYYRENQCEFGKWKEAPRRSEEETEMFYDSIRRFIRMMKNDDRFEITSFGEIAEKVKNEKPRVITKKDIPFIKESLEKDFWAIEKPSYCISDIFLACKALLSGEESHTCGKVYGFLYKPCQPLWPTVVKKEELIAAAKEMKIDKFLPTKVKIGKKVIGPADFIFAALEVLMGAEEVRVEPKPQLPNLDRLPDLRDDSLNGRWIEDLAFEDKYLSDRLRLQIWTYRLLEE